MAGIRLSLLNSETADTASVEAGYDLKPGDELLGVFGIDEPFVACLQEFAATHAPSYSGAASPGGNAIPWLTLSARPDGDVQLHTVVAPTKIAAQGEAQKSTPENEFRIALSLEPEIFETMKKFLCDRQPIDIKIM